MESTETSRRPHLKLRVDVYNQRMSDLGIRTATAEAEYTGITRKTLWRIKGGAPVSTATALTLCDTLGQRIGQLFERADG